MGRTRTVERRKEREQQKKRQRQTAIAIGIVVVAVIAIFLFVLVNQPAEAPIPEGAAARYADIPQGKSEEGFPVLGSDSAPVKVIEYSSFDCPHCEEFHASAIPGLAERARNGEIQLTYVPVYGTGGIANGQGAARAAVCAGEQGQFWAYHDALFNWQGIYVNTAFSQNRLSAGVDNLKLDKAKWEQCMASDTPDKIVNAALSKGQLQNIPGTPAVFVNGTIVQSPTLDTVNQAIDQALAQSGQQPAATTPEATAQATSEVTAEATQEATTEATPEATP